LDGLRRMDTTIQELKFGVIKVYEDVRQKEMITNMEAVDVEKDQGHHYMEDQLKIISKGDNFVENNLNTSKDPFMEDHLNTSKDHFMDIFNHSMKDQDQTSNEDHLMNVNLQNPSIQKFTEDLLMKSHLKTFNEEQSKTGNEDHLKRHPMKTTFTIGDGLVDFDDEDHVSKIKNLKRPQDFSDYENFSRFTSDRLIGREDSEKHLELKNNDQVYHNDFDSSEKGEDYSKEEIEGDPDEQKLLNRIFRENFLGIDPNLETLSPLPLPSPPLSSSSMKQEV